MEYQAVVYIIYSGFVLDYKSGWWDNAHKAKEELKAIMENKLPTGLYQVSEHLRIRRVEQ